MVSNDLLWNDNMKMKRIIVIWLLAFFVGVPRILFKQERRDGESRFSFLIGSIITDGDVRPNNFLSLDQAAA